MPTPSNPDRSIGPPSLNDPAQTAAAPAPVAADTRSTDPARGSATRPADPVRVTRPAATMTWAPPEAPAFPRVPGYEILGELGRGGMGVVYHARQVALNRPVALKMVLGDDRADPKALIRFLAEAEAAAAIRHPNVVGVYDYGEHDGRAFLALEFVGGGSLADRLRGGNTYWPEAAAALVAKIARGVQAAHDLQIVHRDLKPANILLTAADEPKVADFGLAKRDVGRDLTQSQAVMGTPAYMAPEQASGQSKFAGPAADVYALGVILYECLTGVTPFRGEDSWTILRQVIAEDPVPPRKQVAGIPRDLDLICLTCLAKDPADRYPTAAELAADLTRFANHESVTVRPPGAAERAARWARRKPTLAAATLLAGLAVVLAGFAAGLAVLWQQAEEARGTAVAAKGQVEGALAAETTAKGQAETARKEAEQARDREAKARKVAETEKASADGARALVEREKKQTEQALARETEAKTNETTARKHAEDAKKEAEAARAAEAAERAKAETARDAEVRLNAKLAAVEYARTVDLAHREYLGNNVSRAAELLDACDPARRGWEWHYVNRVVRSSRLAVETKFGPVYAVAVGKGGRLATAHATGTVAVWDAASGRLDHELRAHPGGAATDVAFAPDGGKLATGGADGRVRVWDPATGKELPGPARSLPTGTVYSVVFSPDGTRLAAGAADGQVWAWQVGNGEPISTIPGGVGAIYAVRYSPDGKWLAAGGANGSVRVWRRGGTTEQYEVPGEAGAVHALAFDPAGRLAIAGRSGAVRVWDPARNQVVLTFPAHPEDVTATQFTPDGAALVTASTDRSVRVWDAKTGRPLSAMKGPTDPVWCAAVAPDGKRVAAAGQAGQLRVWDLTDPPEPIPVVLGDGGGVNSFALSEDGKRLAAAGQGGGLVVLDIDSGARTRLGSGGGPFAPRRSQAVPARRRLFDPFPVSAFFPLQPDEEKPPPPLPPSQLSPGPLSPGVPAPALSPAAAPSDLSESPRAYPKAGSGERGILPPSASPTQSPAAPAGTESASPGNRSIPSPPPAAPAGTTQAPRSDAAPGGGSANTVPVSPAPDGPAPTANDVRTATGGPGRMSFHSPLRYVGAAGLRFADAGRQVLSLNESPRLVAWDVTGGRPVRTVDPITGTLTAVAFDPAGAWAAVGNRAGRVVVWDVAGGTAVWQLDAHASPVAAVAIDPAGRVLATADLNGTMRLWDIPRRQPLGGTVEAHAGEVAAVAFAPAGDRFATAGVDREVKVWATATGTLLHTFRGHEDWVRTVCFSPDGKRVASGGHDRTVRVWDPETRTAVLTLGGFLDVVTKVQFSPDGRKLVAAGLDGTVRVFDSAAIVPPERAPAPRPAKGE